MLYGKYIYIVMRQERIMRILSALGLGLLGAQLAIVGWQILCGG